MNAETLLVFFVAAIFLQSKNVYGYNSNRIVNGSAAPDEMFEFLSKLTIFNQGYGLDVGLKISGGTCSSTIISKRHILTAAHCVNSAAKIYENSDTKWNYRAHAIFIKHRDAKNKQKNIDSSTPHDFSLNNRSFQTKYYFYPSYVATIKFNDIAIIELPETAKLDITPIKLASDYVEKEGDMAIAAGYGIYKWGFDPATGKKTPESPKVLQNATVPVHPDMSDRNAIVASSKERYADEGDSGGPLMIERNGKLYQVGVNSFVLKFHASGDVKNVYTRLSSYCDWISKVTKGEAKCEPLPAIDPNPPPQPGPVNPPAPPPAPGPSQDETTTQAALNSNITDAPAPNDETDALQPAPNPEPQNSNSNVAFTFNMSLLFLFIGFLVFV